MPLEIDKFSSVTDTLSQRRRRSLLTIPAIMPPRRIGNVIINSRTIVAPILAVTMTALLYVYARTSIQAAKRNAQRHREADGGQINWANENRRQHGLLDRPGGKEKGTVGGIADELGRQMKGEKIREPPKKSRDD